MKKPEEHIKNNDANGRFRFLRLMSNTYFRIRVFQLILGTLLIINSAPGVPYSLP